ncbi:hypothetical protein DXX96_03135 [Lactococcus petauri]|nr:hypothetical protein [Lactococcus petauri]
MKSILNHLLSWTRMSSLIQNLNLMKTDVLTQNLRVIHSPMYFLKLNQILNLVLIPRKIQNQISILKLKVSENLILTHLQKHDLNLMLK